MKNHQGFKGFKRISALLPETTNGNILKILEKIKHNNQGFKGLKGLIQIIRNCEKILLNP